MRNFVFERNTADIYEVFVVQAIHENTAWELIKDRTAGQKEDFEIAMIDDPVIYSHLVVFEDQ